ncbi:MAG: hypothetical protein JRI96_16050 [Deltaproteobacteria bacterium]|nr:hypothetical protein [Deltaproteobacteria bacterium]
MRKSDKSLEDFSFKTLIVAFVNITYLPIFEIWYNYFKQYRLPNFLAISLDKKMHSVLDDLGIKNIMLPMAGFDKFLSKKIYNREEMSNLSDLWDLKMQIIRKIINGGTNLLYCDTDAFWLKNIYPLVENSRYDISASISYHSPLNVVEKWGFVLNCGFLMIRSNTYTKIFIKELMEFLSEEPFYDDQNGLNRFLLQNNTEWKKDSNVENEGYVKRFKIKIKAISDNIISREPKNGVYVYHPFIEGDMDKKLNFVKEKLTLLESKSNTDNFHRKVESDTL